jgi:hypothetical protein
MGYLTISHIVYVLHWNTTIETDLPALMKQLVPAEFEKLELIIDLLPLAAPSGVQPFTGIVFNIQLASEPHNDQLDFGNLCVVLVISDCSGGELILHEAGLILELRSGDFILFRSASQTHFNLPYKGFRAFTVFHTDAHMTMWAHEVEQGAACISLQPQF